MEKTTDRGLDIFAAPQKRLLIIDDEEPLRELFFRFFTDGGYHVTLAVDLSEANKCLANGKFDLVLHDISLPDGNGLDSVRRIKERHPDLPVIMLTALGYDKECMDRAIANGASAYISKFIPLERVLLEIKRVLKSSEPAK